MKRAVQSIKSKIDFGTKVELQVKFRHHQAAQILVLSKCQKNRCTNRKNRLRKLLRSNARIHVFKIKVCVFFAEY